MLRTNPNVARVVFPSLEDAVVDVEVFKSKLRQGNISGDGDKVNQAWLWFLQFVDMSTKKEGKV